MKLTSGSLISGAMLVIVYSAPLLAGGAEENPTLTIRDHRFEPSEVTIPADQKVKLIVRNDDPTPEEFESFDLNREKVVAPGGQIEVFVGPLPSGSYEFFGDFHADTARGHIVVR